MREGAAGGLADRAVAGAGQVPASRRPCQRQRTQDPVPLVVREPGDQPASNRGPAPPARPRPVGGPLQLAVLVRARARDHRRHRAGAPDRNVAAGARPTGSSAACRQPPCGPARPRPVTKVARTGLGADRGRRRHRHHRLAHRAASTTRPAAPGDQAVDPERDQGPGVEPAGQPAHRGEAPRQEAVLPASTGPRTPSPSGPARSGSLSTPAARITGVASRNENRPRPRG